MLALFVALLASSLASGPAPTGEVKVDQVGYLPGTPKLALVVTEHAVAGGFSVRRASDSKVVFQGSLGNPVFDADTGDTVRTAEFTSLGETGTFYVDVPGVGRSWDVRIANDVFSRVYYLVARSYYGQRCGTAVDLGREFPGYKHAICHIDGAYDASSGKTGGRESSHGWHDAGDYGRYVVNSGISTATLLWSWELFGDRIKKVSLKVPESGNDIPDLLNEVKWNIDWLLTMQDNDGGVWHKQTSAHFCGFIMPEADKLTSLAIGTGQAPWKSSCATADFAAVTAIAARVFRPFDAAYATRCLAVSRKAWLWLESNPNVVFRNPPGITTGEYGDNQCGDEHLWAAAELLRTTGEPAYKDYFLGHYREYLHEISAVNPPAWSNMALFALWTLVLGPAQDSVATNDIRQRTVEAADQIVDRASHQAYRVSLATRDYIWGSNGVAGNYSLQLLIANRLRPDKKYFDTALENVHYLLGRNTFGMSWVTQVGSRSAQHIHHRPSAADGIAAPWPGLLAGGPNRGRQDKYMKAALSDNLPPAKNYIDVEGAYACNEVAINWNAPLVFVLAAALPE